MTADMDFLKKRLSEKPASILLGAGFSYGAKNKGGNILQLGSGLSKKLYEHFFVDHPINTDRNYLNKVSVQKENLSEICTILRSEGHQEIRDTYLCNVFSGCHPSGTQFQSKIKNYKWNTIFTLNIDDLVENIFSASHSKLCVWNYSHNGKRIPNAQTLIKLHGDVNAKDDGFVFDSDEYSNFIAEGNCLLKEFAHIFLSGDMVILGSEFQENDISFMLRVYETSGYQNNDCHYFFVMPSIKSISLSNKIQNTENFHWINMDTESFLTFVCDNVVQNENNRNVLKERGAVFLDEISPKENYISEIYYGCPTQYNDFYEEWDIIYPGQKTTLKKITSHHKKVTLVTLSGKPYNGKTTVAKRFLVDLKNLGYIAIELPRVGFDVYESLSSFFYSLPNDSKVALFLENAAYHYQHIISFAKKHLVDLSHLVIITTDTTQNHIGRSHYLADLSDDFEWENFEISEEITPEYAAKVFYKLCVKKRLNNYLKFCPPMTHPTDKNNMYRIWDEMRKTNDIVDVLYFSSEGRYFRDYYLDWFSSHKEKYYSDYIYILSALGKLGISKIPLYALPKLLPDKAARFKTQEFLQRYPDLLEARGGYIKLLRSRLISSVLHPTHEDTLKNAIYQLVRYTLGLFTENDQSESYELFQKALRIKRIRNYSLLSNDQIEDLFTSLEKHCSTISYFWVQFGLAFQYLKRFEDANNCFLYAKSIRSESYQVAHALAKNRMEIGLDDLRKGNLDADEVFNQGCNEMEEIIYNPNFQNAYNYSVHSYAFFIMKYYDKKGLLVPSEKCVMLNKLFVQVIAKPIDVRMKNIIVQFCDYCKAHDMGQYCTGLEDVRKIIPYLAVDEDDVLVD